MLNMMRFVRKAAAAGMFSLQIFFHFSLPVAFAETIELVTYYPAPAAGGGGLWTAAANGTDIYNTNITGNVGIGVTNPQSVLHVQGGAATNYDNLLRLSNPDPDPANPANDAAGIFFDAETRDWAIAATNPSSGFGDGKLVFYDDTAGFPQGARMVIDSTGNVGIGTRTPVPGMRMTVAGQGAGGTIVSGIQFKDTDAGAGTWNISTPPTGGFSISDTLSTRLFVEGNGRVAIGANATVLGSPNDAFLRVITGGSLGNANGIYVEAAGSNSNGIYGRHLLGGVGSVGVRGEAAGRGVVGIGATGVEASGTNVGVLASSTNTNGVAVLAAATGANSIGVNGSSTGATGIGVLGLSTGASSIGVRASGTQWDFWSDGPNSFGNPSSIRWKREVQPIENALDKVLKLRGVSFVWDEAHGGKRDLGMIAEEVGKIFPEFVVYEANGIDAMGMDYSQLTSVLVEAVKDQQKQIEELRTEIRRLKKSREPKPTSSVR